MVVVRSLRPEHEYTIDSKENLEVLFINMRHLFNHHSYLNYILLKDSKTECDHLLRFVTLNQPYEDPFSFSVILRPIHYSIDPLDLIQKQNFISLNHLPYSLREMDTIFNFPLLKSEHKLKETPFCKDYIEKDKKIPCLLEACIKLGFEYDSHVVIVEKTTVLVKFRLKYLAYDEAGFSKMTNPGMSHTNLLSLGGNQITQAMG